jgi:hypothetical protein
MQHRDGAKDAVIFAGADEVEKLRKMYGCLHGAV